MMEEIITELDQRRIQAETTAATEYEAVLAAQAAQAAQEQQANAANESTNPTTMEALLSTMAAIQAQVNNNNNNNNNRYRGRGRDRHRNSGNRNQRNGGRGEGRDNHHNNNNRSRVAKYCWSHGNCAHSGSECNNPKNGHKNEATFTNMMNGSDYDMWKRNT